MPANEPLHPDKPPSWEEAIEMLKGWQQDPSKRELWNTARRRWPAWKVVVGGANLAGVDLAKADLRGVSLGGVNLVRADLGGVNLEGARLVNANLDRTNLAGANLNRANLGGARLVRADLAGADLSGTSLKGTNLRGANLRGTNLYETILISTIISDTDLLSVRDVMDLVTCTHLGPSFIDTHTLRRSKGRIPAAFLRGCGLEKWEVEMTRFYDHALDGHAMTETFYKIFDMRKKGPIGGVFISYCHADDHFVDNLHAALAAKDINVWRDVHDLTAGPLVRQVVDAIRRNDVVLLVLSEAALKSDWVEFEIKRAREREKKEDRVILCPVAIDKAWEKAVAGKPHLSQLAGDRVILPFDPTAGIGGYQNATAFDKLIRGMKLFYTDTANGTPTP